MSEAANVIVEVIYLLAVVALSGAAAAVASRTGGMKRLVALAVAACSGAEAGGAVFVLCMPIPTRSLDMRDDPANANPWVVEGVDPNAIAREVVDPDRFHLDSRTRIVVLGDSFAAGNGVGRGWAFPSLLESARFDVVNLAVPGASLRDEVAIYEDLGASLAPDIVVLAVVLNDLGGSEAVDTGGGRRLLDLFERFTDGYHKPYSIDLVWDAWGARRATALLEQRYQATWSSPRHLASFRDGIARLQVAAERTGARVLVVVLPMLHRLDAYPFADAHRQIGEVSASLGVDFLDGYDVVRGRDESSLWASVLDHHPNVEAHRLFANQLRLVLPTHSRLERSKPIPLESADLWQAMELRAEDRLLNPNCDVPGPWLAVLAESWVALRVEREGSDVDTAVREIGRRLHEIRRRCEME